MNSDSANAPGYTTEYIEVVDNFGVNWGNYLHYFSRSIAGMEKALSDEGKIIGFREIEPSLRDEIGVSSTTVSLARNVTYAMGQHNAVLAGTFYIRNDNGSFPLDNDEGEIGDIFFLLHVRFNDKFYSGVYKVVGDKLVWYYLPDWI